MPLAMVFYRQRVKRNDSGEIQTYSSYQLGELNRVFERVAKYIGIEKAILTYSNISNGPWMHAMHLLRSAQIMIDSGDRWRLNPIILDRLHEGKLMKTLLRGGRACREKLHNILEELWREIDISQKGLKKENERNHKDRTAQTHIVV